MFEVHMFGFFLLGSLFFLCHGSDGTREKEVLDIGVILDYGSLAGKEARLAMKIARDDFNAESRGYELRLHHENSHGKPLHALSSAEKLIKRKKVKAIIGLETWKVAELVAELANQFQIPVISLARNRPMIPGLIQMGTDESGHIKFIADIVKSFNRRRVTIIYEEDVSDDNYSLSLYLSKELHIIGSEVENSVVLPRFSSLPDPELSIKEKLTTLKRNLSTVFVILDLSLPMASHLLREAKEMESFNGETIWILSESVVNVLGWVNANLTNSILKGAIGIVTDFPRKNKQYLDFARKFGRNMKFKTGDFGPGIHALRAYDSVSAVTKAMTNIIRASGSEITPKFLTERILQSRFDGVSGEIEFKDGRISSNPGKAREVIIGGGENSYRGVMRSRLRERTSSTGDVRDQSGKMRIAVPIHTPFDKFVKGEITDSGTTTYVGFCIDVFNEIRNIFLNRSQSFEYDFYPEGCTYDDLVRAVHNKTYGGTVGDVTILAERSNYVDFTQPFIESGLSMIVLEEVDEDKTWMFIKPFNGMLWMATGVVLVCTMLTVWYLERPLNPEFQGSWPQQLATALWFTFSSLFFAHRERIHRNHTRAVLVVWFFMALILTQSYPASLTSMLTVQQLKPNEITIERLRQNNDKVGCDNTTFVCNYLETVHYFNKTMIVGISNYTDIYEQLKIKKSIKAMFVEYPYERAFFSRYCTGFSVTHQSYRFGGFGFAFQKGSPWTASFSEAILELSESGKLKTIGDNWFKEDCIGGNSTSTNSDSKTQSLGLESFWALYAFSLGTSVICLLLSFFCSRRNNGGHGRPNNGFDRDREMDELDQNHGR